MSVEKQLYEYGAEKRREIGNNTDETLLKFIEENPAYSLYQLAGAIGWNVGKVGESIKRLSKKDKIKIRRVDKGGRILKKIFPKDFEYFNCNEVDIPKDLIKSNPSWKDEAHIYGLDESTIGISGEPEEEWERKSDKKIIVRIKQHPNEFRLNIPKEFCEDYRLASSEVSQTIVGDKVLIMREGTILGDSS